MIDCFNGLLGPGPILRPAGQSILSLRRRYDEALEKPGSAARSAAPERAVSRRLHMGRVGCVSCLVAVIVAGAAAGQPGAAPKAPPTVIELLEDDTAELIAQLTSADQGAGVGRDFRDFYCGVCSVRVTP